MSDIIPDVNGELLIDFSTTQIAQWGFNAGMIIQDYTDAQGGSVLYMSNSILDSASEFVSPPVNTYKVRIYPNPFTDVATIEFRRTGPASAPG